MGTMVPMWFMAGVGDGTPGWCVEKEKPSQLMYESRRFEALGLELNTSLCEPRRRVNRSVAIWVDLEVQV